MYQIELSELQELDHLSRDWDDLCRQAGPHHAARGYHWNRTCWQVVARPRGRSLLTLIGRRDGRTVMIWPFTQRLDKGIRIIRPLSAEASEYNTVLIEAGQDAEALIILALATLRARRAADVVDIPFVLAGTPLHRVLAATRELSPSYARPSHAVDWTGVQSWDSYYEQRLGKKHRRNNARLRKQLGTLGTLSFERPDEPARKDELVCWLIARKRDWLIRNNDGNDWIPADDYLEFLRTMIRDQPQVLEIFALCLDGVPLAAELSAVDDGCVESMISAYDAEHARYSPGQLLQEDCLKWAFDRRLPYDFRMGWESYKQTWANSETSTHDHHLSLSFKGMAYIAVNRMPGTVTARLRSVVGNALPPRLKEHAKVLARGGSGALVRLGRDLGFHARR